MIGRRLGTRVAAGQLLAPSQLEEGHAVVAPGRVQVTVPVEPYTASAGTIGSGDSVVVYSTPHQAPDRWIGAVGDGRTGASAGRRRRTRVRGIERQRRGSIGSLAATGQPVWITLDLTTDDGARVIAASRLGSIDVALKARNRCPPDDRGCHGSHRTVRLALGVAERDCCPCGSRTRATGACAWWPPARRRRRSWTAFRPARLTRPSWTRTSRAEP